MSREFVGNAHDFDFLIGRWNVLNRRLRQRHVGSSEWDEFPGESTCWSLLDGISNVDEIHFPTRGFSGATVRTLDLAQRRWSIHWINSSKGELEPPVHGGFQGVHGEFYGEDTDDGRPAHVRFFWTRHRDAPRWEQAFSADGGRTWETNWTMDFSRAPSGAAGTTGPGRGHRGQRGAHR